MITGIRVVFVGKTRIDPLRFALFGGTTIPFTLVGYPFSVYPK